MIKAGIIGGSDRMAGELIRILINHPDVEILWAHSVKYGGRAIADVHHGLVGETELRFAQQPDLNSVDVIFLCLAPGETKKWLEGREIPEDLRIIDLSPDMIDPVAAEQYDFVYGLPELNRKPMVRGARRAAVPSVTAHIAALGLLPLAKNLLLNAPIDAEIALPKGLDAPDDVDAIAAEIAMAMRELQTSYAAPISLTYTTNDDHRAVNAVISLPTSVDIGEITREFEEFYDDHNFVFLVGRHPEAKDVEGTNKGLIYIDKADGRLRIDITMDGVLKGSAGTAVHDMNLLFGLHERIALALKASTL